MTDPKKAQSIVEYMILMAAVIVVLIIFLHPSRFFSNKISGYMNGTVNTFSDMVNQINAGAFR